MRRVSVRSVLVASLILVLTCPLVAKSSPMSALFSPGFGQASLADLLDNQSVGLVGHIGGTATVVAVRGKYAYTACGPRLVTLDVSNPANPTVVGTSAPLPGLPQGMALSADHAYVAAGQGGVWIINVSDPAHPAHVGRYAAPWFARKVAVAGNYAYITAAVYQGIPPGGGLQIVNVSDPAGPIAVAWYGAGYSNYDGVAVVGQYVYYAAGTLRVLDVADPAHPTLVGSYTPTPTAFDVQVVGGYAYVAVRSGLRIVNVADPTNPIQAGSYDVPGYGWPHSYCRVSVEGDYAYLADQEGGLYILDVSNPAQPAQAGFYSTPGFTWGLATAGGKVYLATDRAGYSATHWLGGGLHIVNVSDPVHPAEAGVYQTWGSAEGLSVHGDHAYVADRNGVHAVSISAPTRPTEASFYDTGGAAYDVSVEGGLACVGDGTEGLRVLNVSDPAHPSEVGFYDTPGDASYVAKAGDYAYLMDYDLGLRIIHLADPAHPSEVGFYGVSTPRDVVVAGHYAYALAQEGLHIVDVVDPAHPAGVGFLSIQYCRRLAVDGDYAYVTVYGNVSGLRIINIHDPAHPTPLSFYQTGAPRGVAAKGHLAFIGVGTALRVLEVSNPLHPVQVGVYNLPDTAYDVGLAGDNICVADGLGGLFILQFLPYDMYLPLGMRNRF